MSYLKILNLGCGTKTSDHPGVVNIDWSIYLRLKQLKIFSLIIPLLVGKKRAAKYCALSDNVVVHNLARGIPFESNTVDVVYHSHILEHFDRDYSELFMLEAMRVLKKGGIHRVVVPDLELICKEYLDHIDLCCDHPTERSRHDDFIANLIEQSVRREASGTGMQKPLRRFIENVVLGDARKRGETHQWMYDRINLSHLMVKTGFRDVSRMTFEASAIPDWNKYRLDCNEDGSQYKEKSLYMEARK